MTTFIVPLPPQFSASHTFYVYATGGTTYGVDASTGIATYSGSTASSVLNSLQALASASSQVVAILDPALSVDSATVTVSHPNFVLWGRASPQGSGGGLPLIPALTYTDTSAKITGTLVQGVTINTLIRNAGSTGNGFSFNTFSNCSIIRKSGTATAAIADNYEANGTGVGIQYTGWENCWFDDESVSNTVEMWTKNCGTGAATSNGHDDMTLCWYVNATGTLTNDIVFLHVTGAINSGPPIINSSQFDFVTLQSGSGFTCRAVQCTVPTTGTQEASFLFNNTYFESSAVASTKSLTAFSLVSGAGGQYEGRASFANTHLLGSLAFYVVDTGTTAPAVQSTKDSGVYFSGYSNTGTPKGAQGTYFNIAPGLVQATGGTAAVLTQSGVGTAGWYVRVELTGAIVGFKATALTAPSAGVYLINLYPFEIEFHDTSIGTSGACSIKNQDGTTQALATLAAGAHQHLKPLEGITFATAWPTTFEIRGR